MPRRILAALRYRIRELKADQVIYVVGAPQTQHLAMVFATGRLAGWVAGSTRIEHVAFGSILGPDKKVLKSRSGEPLPLVALIDEAVERATRVVDSKSPDMEASVRASIAIAVGIGAVKYADLSSDRIKDYIFDWDRMLSFDGNTAPYIMYAHARCRSILRKAGGAGVGPIRIAAAQERALALELLQLPVTVARTAESLQPHRICGFLYQLAQSFTAFFEACPVIKADEPTRASRLALCELTARTLAQGLDLLGIAAPDQM